MKSHIYAKTTATMQVLFFIAQILLRCHICYSNYAFGFSYFVTIYIYFLGYSIINTPVCLCTVQYTTVQCSRARICLRISTAHFVSGMFWLHTKRMYICEKSRRLEFHIVYTLVPQLTQHNLGIFSLYHGRIPTPRYSSAFQPVSRNNYINKSI